MKHACNLLALGVLAGLSSWAQDFRATISGRVTDVTGAAIPDAKVTATQVSTNQATTRTSNQEGYFTLTYLLPSTYTIEVEAQGFKRLKRDNVTLLVADKIDLPFQLEIGEMNQQVTVSATTEILQTGDASGGLNFDSNQTSEYPLNGRQVYMLMALTPGVLFTQEQFGATGYSGTRGWDVSSSYVMNGGVQGTNSFTLNGAPISITGTWQLAPNIDAIQEFKVQTNTYDSSVGRTGGGTVNTTLKSGSNNWHGTLFDFMRNEILDANYTQNNQIGAPRTKHITHQFGGTLGGALKKDRDFIFVSFEGFHEIVPFPVVANVPPMDMRTGQNFAGYGQTIYDPSTGTTCVSKVSVSGTCSSTFVRQPFPGDVIPLSRISPIGAKILSYYPAPNTYGVTQNFVDSGSTGLYHYYQPIVRYDRMIDANDRFNAVITFQHGQEFRNSTGIPGEAEAGDIDSQRTDFNAIASYTRILSPTSILDIRASYGRFTSYFPDALTSGVTASSLGMTGLQHAPTSTLNVAPMIQIDDFTDLFGNGANLYTWATDNQWDFAPTLTLTHGAMTLRFGVEGVYAMQATGSIGQSNGSFDFTQYGTQQYPLAGTSASVGAGIASLLLGIPTSGFEDWNGTFYRTWPYFAIFAQNDWKLARNLTLNLGLRYDVQIPFVERFNRVDDGFNFNTTNPASAAVTAAWAKDQAAYMANKPATVYPAAPAALLGGKDFIQPGGSRRPYNTDWEDIQPRVGLAWNFAPKTVLRTGFGIYHATATQADETDGFSEQTPYIRTLNADQTPSAGLTGPYSLQNPFPNGLIQPPGSALGYLTNVGNSITVDLAQRPIPRTFQYSFGLQRQFPWAVLIDAAYVGSITDHVSMPYNIDYLSLAQDLAAQKTPATLNDAVPNPFYGILPSNTTLGASSTIAAKYLYYAYPMYSAVTIETNPWGRYRYDALQLRATKRFTGDRAHAGALTTVLSYTFSKNFQTVNRLNNWDIAETPVHELVSYDKPQNLSASGVWDLPFGRNRALLSNSNKWVNGLVGGWTLNYIFTYNSGIPVAGMNYIFSCASPLVADQSHDHWFNNTKTCYKSLANYQLRTVPDRYPWLRQMDNMTMNLAAAKTFQLTERWRFNLRGEAFNLANHPLYGAPDTTDTDARFGMLPVAQQNFPRLIQISAKLLF